MPTAEDDDRSNVMAQAEAVYGLLNEEVSERMAILRSSAERIETKATFLAGFAVTASTILLDADELDTPRRAVLMLFAIAFIAALSALAVWRWEDPPQPDEVIRLYSKNQRIDALAGIVGSKAAAYARNSRRLDQKARAWYAAALFLGVGLLVLLATEL